MNRILLSILILGIAISKASVIHVDMMGSGGVDEVDEVEEEQVMLTVPMNLQADVMSSSVLITWDVVEGATGYQVTIENVTDQNAQESQILISGLMPQTTYTAMIKSTRDEEMTDAAEITFTTLLAGVQNLEVVEATETEIEIMWEIVESAISYTVVVEADVEDAAQTLSTTSEISVRLVGLLPMTFYTIYVTAESAEGSSDVTSLRTRTDGSGIKIEGVWQNSPKEIFGGQILVLRPLQIPRGSYSIEVSVPCALTKVNVWNADLNMDVSVLDLGTLVVTQSQSWQRAMGEIGLNFEFEEGSNCSFGAANPATAIFGVNIGSEVTIETVELPGVRNEWLNAPNFRVRSAGLFRVRLNRVYANTNVNPDGEEAEKKLPSKPAIYDFVIAINPGPECPGGITLSSVWSMTPRDTDGIIGAQPGFMYFVQEGTDWYSNEAGFIYGYDPSICPNRSGITAEVMIGGDFVQAVVDAPPPMEEGEEKEEEEEEEQEEI